MRNYNKIKAFQLADSFVLKIYKVTKSFPKDELYGLVSQLRRASVSIPTNIVEGASRKHKKEYLQFLYISKGSSAEVEYLISLSKKMGYLNDNQFEQLNSNLQETIKTLVGLIKYIERN